MQFNSYIFAAFFAVVLAVYYAPGINWSTRKLWLLVTSYLFYAAWDPVFIVLVWLCTVVDWFSAKWIYRADTKGRKKALFILSLIINLGLLGYFKYGGFVVDNVNAALAHIGLEIRTGKLDIVLPIGISFYTFHTLSYTMDVYLGRTKPTDKLLDFALYVTFFPALVAGPILRASQFLPQCSEPRSASKQQFAWGLALLILGLFEKTVLADVVMAPTADQLFATQGHASLVDAWTGTLAFAGQIFCDFAGYSTCAIGISLCLGFSLPNNFRYPYAAIGFSDFWQRWHISLSSWLRDYLYIPLGGNRRGSVRTYVNLLTTMLIGGLWHGASWTFVVWGGLHGSYLVGERVVQRVLPQGAWRSSLPAKLGGAAITFGLVCVAWVFFRASSFAQAFAIVASMLGLGGHARVLDANSVMLVVPTMLAILATHWALRDRSLEDLVERAPTIARSIALTAMLLAIIFLQGPDRAFIYFQF